MNWTPSDDCRLLLLIQNGLSRQEIARSTGIDPHKIGDRLCKLRDAGFFRKGQRGANQNRQA